MSKEKHTPFKIRNITRILGYDDIKDANDKDILHIVHLDNDGRKYVDFILQSVNNHDRLVEALENMIEWHGEGVKKKSFRDVMSAAKQLLTELKQQ